jgi:AcrR family transcriptional regulator
MSVSRSPTRAERRDRTRADLVAAAERLFVEQGFHATSVDQVAAAAGYTKGAVYSNFAAKEDLFFAVYEQRAAAARAEAEALVRELGPAEGLHRLARDTTTRRGREDGWLAVFFEFWAHVLRHPELRERFVQVRAQTRAPLEDALQRVAADRDAQLPLDPAVLAGTMRSAQVAIALERLTDPALIDPDLGERVSRVALDILLERLGGEDP